MPVDVAPRSGGTGGETKYANEREIAGSFVYLVSPPDLAACCAGRPRRLASVPLCLCGQFVFL